MVLLCCLAGFLKANTQPTLSEEATISLVTVAPGEALYTTFGHSALEVQDPVNRISRCFNYGTFDFEQPNFILKFMQGRLLYFLNIERANLFDLSNLEEGRTMRELPLLLDSIQKQKLFAFLMHNVREENRYYQYDFFYDNCATRIRDAINYTLGSELIWDSTHLPPQKTMRQLLHGCLATKPWTKFGIDLILGLPADHKASAQDYMFLPDHMHTLFANARFTNGQPLTGPETVTPPGGFPQEPFVPAPWQRPLLITLLVVIVAIYLPRVSPLAGQIIGRFIWAILGLAGIIIAYLWFFTDHDATKYNLNLLWAFPTHLALVFLPNHRSRWVSIYKIIIAIPALIILIGWFFLPQEFPLAAAPLVAWVAISGILSFTTLNLSRRAVNRANIDRNRS